ncbi:MAG: hydrogenase maturation protease [Deltaproteobacteria bacterium]|nr:hydrogenase maturation protease [Deltaproteobacteria bacterium]
MNKEFYSKVLIVAAGNEARGDDGVGPVMARELEKFSFPGTRIEYHNGDSTCLLAYWAKIPLVIVLDSVKEGVSPGKTYRFEIPGQPIPFQIFSDFSTHQLGIQKTIELGRALGQFPSRLIIYGVEGRCFEMGSGLSGEVRMAAARVVRRVKKDIQGALERALSRR